MFCTRQMDICCLEDFEKFIQTLKEKDKYFRLGKLFLLQLRNNCKYTATLPKMSEIKTKQNE